MTPRSSERNAETGAPGYPLDAFLEQYQGAPASKDWQRHYLVKSTDAFGEAPIGSLGALEIARWRARLPETMRHGAHRALRQVLAAAVRWQWIDRNPAVDVANPQHPRPEFLPFETWQDLDLQAGVFTVRRAFAKGRLKTYAKTTRSRRRVPLRTKVVAGIGTLPRREGVLFPAAEGGRINIDNFRTREWVPALKGARLEHRRIYDMRHTFATWSLAAGMSIFTLARRMGTSVQVIDATYGHLARDADEHDRELLDAYDATSGHVVGTESANEQATEREAA